MAGALGIEPRSRVLETLILTVVLCPYTIGIIAVFTTYQTRSFAKQVV